MIDTTYAWIKIHPHKIKPAYFFDSRVTNHKVYKFVEDKVRDECGLYFYSDQLYSTWERIFR